MLSPVTREEVGEMWTMKCTKDFGDGLQNGLTWYGMIQVFDISGLDLVHECK